jgi:hypothetical protein
MIKNVYRASCKKSILYSCPILMQLEFSRQIFENPRISNLMKIGPVGAELFRADGRTDMTKLIVAFGNFANAPKSATPRMNHLKIDDIFKSGFITEDLMPSSS